ncbi:TolC family protein, partial [Pseudomonas sp. AB12(2023)]
QSQQFLHAIASLSGQAAAEFRLAPAGSAMLPPALPQALAAEILQRRPDIASAQRGVAYANANIGVARAAAFPTLMLQANAGWNSNQ